MKAGKLRSLVELQRVAVSTDSHGDQVKTWTKLADAWAEVLPLSGREFLQASQVMADITVRVRIRAIPGVTLTPKDRVKFGARTFDIRHIVDWGGRGIEWQLLCTERF